MFYWWDLRTDVYCLGAVIWHGHTSHLTWGEYFVHLALFHRKNVVATNFYKSGPKGRCSSETSDWYLNIYLIEIISVNRIFKKLNYNMCYCFLSHYLVRTIISGTAQWHSKHPMHTFAFLSTWNFNTATDRVKVPHVSIEAHNKCALLSRSRHFDVSLVCVGPNWPFHRTYASLVFTSNSVSKSMYSEYRAKDWPELIAFNYIHIDVAPRTPLPVEFQQNMTQ